MAYCRSILVFLVCAFIGSGLAGHAQAAESQPPTPIPFDEALLRAANDLFSKAALPPPPAKVELVIDPLIDAATGAQSTATRLMQERIKDLVGKSYPRIVVRPFS